jgi:spore germination cell wall hydrolase CwlJ-like protein
MQITRLVLLSIGLGVAAALGATAEPAPPPESLALAAALPRDPGAGQSRFAQTRPAREGTAALHLDPDWIARMPAPRGNHEWQCLARAVYFEARGEPLTGQFAVAEVILNRVESPRYPKSICAVVNQAGRGGCQFSFTCDGLSDAIRERAAFQRAGKVARLMLDGAPRVLTGGATHFHTREVRPGWARRLPQTAMIGRHLFYRDTSGS